MSIKFFARLLAFLIDALLVLLPASFLLTAMGVEGTLANLLPQLLFMVYNIVALSSFEGRTIGKHFAGLRVSGQQRNALFLGIREVAKLLYFIPLVGVLFASISVILLVTTGKTFHDWLGMSQVWTMAAYRKQFEKSDQYESRLL